MKRRLVALLLLVLLVGSLSRAGNRNTWPLPEDRGIAGTLAALQRLPIYARVLHTTAHPDDEAAGTLVWLSRKVHARTALFSLTRGEGGQNILGKEKYEAMGLLRTGELLEACRYYGTELYFSTAFDFGFSKNAAEALSKWGHEEILEEMVRFIRIWRPTLIISRFQGNSKDGHGHHQAAGILTLEAFRAAGDPQRFPQHFKLGLQPWQAQKLYSGTGGGDPGRSQIEEKDWTVRIPVGDYDPVLGRSYREIGSEGYSKHRSQGNGANAALPGKNYDYYKLIDSTVGAKPKEESFFDSVDTSLAAIKALSGNEVDALPFLGHDLAAAQKAGEEALRVFDALHPERSAREAAKGAVILMESIRRIENSTISPPKKNVLLEALHEKLHDFQDAVNALLGIYLVVRSDEYTLVPGTKENVSGYLYNRGSLTIDWKGMDFSTAKGMEAAFAQDVSLGEIPGGESRPFKFAVTASPTAEFTQPYWYRESKSDVRYKWRDGSDAFVPFGKPIVVAEAIYRFQGIDIPIRETVRGRAGDPIRGADFVDLQVVPAVSVALAPELVIVPISKQETTREFQVTVLNNAPAGKRGLVKVISPSGWKVTPETTPFTLQRKGETFSARFTLTIPPGTAAGTHSLEAVASAEGLEFRSEYHVVSYPENWTRALFSPARSAVEVFDLKISRGVTVGYVVGAGDDVPESLEQLGAKVHVLSGSDLAYADLGQFSAIVTGIRAYNVNEDLKANNQRLLKYVEQGGVLVVQYNTPAGGGPSAREKGSPFPYAPFPLTLSTNDRITDEESPVEILDPQNPIFTAPNEITASDFQGWVQERGLYFAKEWDPRFIPLLSGHDPGEDPKQGGLMIAKVGKGYYIYTAYAWFRQLPAGVPGAHRIFANILSLGAK